MRAFKFAVPQERVQIILNTLYSLFLGLLATQFVSQVQDTKGNLTDVAVHLTRENWLGVALLVTYFVFDWLTATITVDLRRQMNHLLMIVLLFFISYLGILVVFSFVPQWNFYILFTTYAVTVPWWDLLVPRKSSSDPPHSQGRPSDIVAQQGASPLDHGYWATNCILGLRLTTGFMLVGLLFFERLGPSELDSGFQREMLALIAVYVALKIARYLAYAHYFPSTDGGSR